MQSIASPTMNLRFVERDVADPITGSDAVKVRKVRILQQQFNMSQRFSDDQWKCWEEWRDVPIEPE